MPDNPGPGMQPSAGRPDVGRVVVVGASLAGIRAAETLRAMGFSGDLVVVGDEAHTPYDRPPLSKEMLTAETEPEIGLRAVSNGLDATLELGVAATALRVHDQELDLADGRTMGYDSLVIATGCSARELPGTTGMSRVRTLRTLDDARTLCHLLRSEARRVAVVGGGFIGLEVAASCRTLGIEVTLVEPLPQPLARVLGEPLGAVVADLHRSHGVDVRVGVGVSTVEQRQSGPSDAVRVDLSDGETIDADVVVVGIGVTPRTQWLEGSGLSIDNGIVCDSTTLAGPGVVAAGDIARWYNPLFDEVMRVEHWEHALEMGSHAAKRLLSDDASALDFSPVPWFWSDQYDRKIQFAGRAHPDDEQVLVAGSLEENRFCVVYGRAGRLVGVLGMNMPAQVVRCRRQIAEQVDWDDVTAQEPKPG